MFIKKLKENSNLSRIKTEFNDILEKATWGEKNQIGLKCRAGAADPWFDSAGSLYDRSRQTRLSSESDFNVWNLPEDSYIRQQIEALEKAHNFKSGRARIMRLLPHTGLSVHKDDEVRYHLVLKTNIMAYIAHNVINYNPDKNMLPTKALCYNLPMDSFWYEVDTREVHWVYNGGPEERIHLVVSGE